MTLKFKAELIFVLLTSLISVLIMLPIWNYYGEKYTFYFYNTSFIILFLMAMRYLFLLKFTPISHNKIAKLIIIFLCLPLILYYIDGIYEFNRYLDEVGFVDISKGDPDEAMSMASYTRTQYLFFGVSALITLGLLPFRMVVSIWRVTNKKGTV
ncbi:MAG TPA: hypothetical protein PKD85_04005 [Saprospiraceae bacterium]|nr:hypothetical protein [Saprospiraceae bacterium]